MRIPSRFNSWCRGEGQLRSVRNLACLTIFSFGAISLAAAQQPAQDNAAKPPVAKAPATATAPAPADTKADTSKPATPENPHSAQQKQLADDTAQLVTWRMS